MLQLNGRTPGQETTVEYRRAFANRNPMYPSAIQPLNPSNFFWKEINTFHNANNDKPFALVSGKRRKFNIGMTPLEVYEYCSRELS